MQKSFPRIVWHKPLHFRDLSVGAPNLNFDAKVSEARRERSVELRTDPLVQALMRVGIPLIEGAETAVDLARGLLQVAAEVEQALMVQYLYAATSVSSAANSRIDYRRKLLRIAIQEMGHLATVQNLLLLVGGREAFHLQRDQLRTNSGKNPIPFVLQPVSRPSLAEYVAAEMPAQPPPERKQQVDELVALAQTTAHVDLHRVGAIYTVLKWLFLPSAEADAWLPLTSWVQMPANPHIKDGDLTPAKDVSKFEALKEEWHDSAEDIILETCRSTSEAVHAIDLVSKQGEGLDGAQKSHFLQFLELVEAFDAGLMIAQPLAVSPNLGTGHGAEGGETISYPYSTLWGQVFSRQYGLLVLSIYQALRTPRDGDESTARRSAIAEATIKSMQKVIARLMPLIAALPMKQGDPSPAGPPFDLDPALLQPGSDIELVKRHLTVLDELGDFYVAIQQSPDFAGQMGHAVQLQNLRKFDQDKRNILSPIAGANIA